MKNSQIVQLRSLGAGSAVAAASGGAEEIQLFVGQLDGHVPVHHAFAVQTGDDVRLVRVDMDDLGGVALGVVGELVVVALG